MTCKTKGVKKPLKENVTYKVDKLQKLRSLLSVD